jgi:hypothetical protein
MTDLSALTADDFEPLVDTEFRRSADDGHEASLRLVEVGRRGRQWQEREGFALLFRDPGEIGLGQGMHPLRHETLGELEIFLVPVARTEDGWEYEAVFT